MGDWKLCVIPDRFAILSVLGLLSAPDVPKGERGRQKRKRPHSEALGEEMDGDERNVSQEVRGTTQNEDQFIMK